MIRPYETTFRAMGSEFNVWLETEADGEAVLKQVPDWVEAIEARLTRFRPESELSQLNAHSGKWVTVSGTLLQAILAARQAAWLTDGLCNPLVLPALVAAGYERSFAQMQRDGLNDSRALAVPSLVPDWHSIEIKPKQHLVRLAAGSQIDLGGTGKGWSAQQIANRLSAYGPCLVDAGGDLVARGNPSGKPGWEIDISDPGHPESFPPVATVTVSDAAIATSGIDYRRWMRGGKMQHHLIDPRTGQPAESDVLAATVIHSEAVLAEAYTKVLIILGAEAGMKWITQQPQQAALVVRKNGEVLVTADFLAIRAELA
jgi:thiamine biosynthesis lipoprotein